MWRPHFSHMSKNIFSFAIFQALGSHKISAQKFKYVRSFLEIGCSVLMSDIDVVYLQVISHTPAHPGFFRVNQLVLFLAAEPLQLPLQGLGH